MASSLVDQAYLTTSFLIDVTIGPLKWRRSAVPYIEVFESRLRISPGPGQRPVHGWANDLGGLDWANVNGWIRYDPPARTQGRNVANNPGESGYIRSDTTWKSPLIRHSSPPPSSNMEPNPPPYPSMLPDSLLELRIRPDPTNALTPEEREALSLFQRVGNYMAAAMIYLRDNALLEEDLKAADIKPRLLGEFPFRSPPAEHH
jgi:XFP N-terminal domain